MRKKVISGKGFGVDGPGLLWQRKPRRSFRSLMLSAIAITLREPIYRVCLGLLAAIPFLVPIPAHAVALTNCTAADLKAAILSGAPLITFSCSGTISLTNGFVIPDSLTLDAGTNSVILDGGTTTTSTTNSSLTVGSRFFVVTNGGTVTLRHLILTNGFATNGGAIYIYRGSAFVAEDCVFSGNMAKGTNGLPGTPGSNASVNGGGGGGGGSGKPGLGGAIYNLGTAILSNCTFQANSAEGGQGGAGGNGGNVPGDGFRGGRGGVGGNGGAGFGGAIYNTGVVTIASCTFAENSVTGGDAGNGGSGGTGGVASSYPGSGGAGGPGSGAGLYNLSIAHIYNSTFSDNLGEGGNSAAGGTQDNRVGSNGANGADSLGGGVYNAGSHEIVNCTFSGNEVNGGNGGNGGNGDVDRAGNGGNGGIGAGGGFYNAAQLAGITNCTFSGNGAIGGLPGVAGTGLFSSSNGSPGPSRGANIANGGGIFYLNNSIIANPTGGTNTVTRTNITSVTNITPESVTCVTNSIFPLQFTCTTNSAVTNITVTTNVVTATTTGSSANSYGTVTDTGFNLSSDASLAVAGPGTMKNTDPKLGALADNGGPTMTLALLAGSPAIDAGDPGFCTGNNFCLATDQRGATRPSGSRVDIGSYEYGGAPVIVSQPSDVTVASGGNASFTATATGDRPLSFQWRYNQSEIPGATNSSYVVTNVTEASEGNYDVVVTNFSGTVTSREAVLTIQSPPALTQQPADQTVAQNAMATFSVSAAGDETLTYAWRFNGTNIADAPSAATYTIDSATTNMNGNYDVVITNQFGATTSSVARLTVLIPPAITTAPQSQTVAAGATVTFQVRATGGEPLSYVWRSGETQIQGATNTTYTISNVSAANQGNYDVVVVNPVGSVISAPPATLTVTAVSSPPAITVQPASQTVSAGGNATFTVSATGPQLKYQWYFSGAGALSGATNTSLTLTAVGTNNTGNYWVVITNNFGSVTSQTATLTIGIYNLGGRITKNGQGLANVAVTAAGKSASSDANGYYIISNLPPGSVTVTPSLSGQVFNPPSRTQTLQGDINNANFTAIPVFTISGQVVDGTTDGADGPGLAGVTVRAVTTTPPGTNTIQTDFFGNYILPNVPGTSNVISCSFNGYLFTPASTNVLITSNTDLATFIATRAYILGGRLLEGSNGIPGIVVHADSTNGISASVVSDSQGNYAFTFPPTGTSTYTVQPATNGIGFSNPVATITLAASRSDVDFYAKGVQLSLTSRSNLTQITLLGIPNSTYLLQAASDPLSNIAWQLLSTNTANASGLSAFTEPRQTNIHSRLYRAIKP